MRQLSLILLLFLGAAVSAQSLKNGLWRGQIHYDSVSVPFIFEVIPSGTDVPEIVFINGKERRSVKNARIEGDNLFIPLDPFDVTLEASFSATEMSGVYLKHYRGASFPFSASFGWPRFQKSSPKTAPKIQERWAMTFEPGTSSKSIGVGLFKQQGEQVTGTVLTTVSDYRYFEGILDGDSLKLSSFDGAHAFMILGKMVAPKQWEGVMIFDNNFEEKWTATYDSEAALEDPFEMVEVEPGTEQPYYDLLGAGSGNDVIDPAKYEGKVLIIQLFGTWCPNSHDETQYLVKWYNENKDRDVAILASSYEANYSQEYGLERLDAYQTANEIPYDLVLGGRLSKRSAAMPFSFMDRIEAFPTLVILDKKGYVRYVHSYFNGPATGTYYSAFDERFNAIIDELLSE